MTSIIDETAGWPDVPLLATRDLVLGGPNGPSNKQAIALAARIGFLRESAELLKENQERTSMEYATLAEAIAAAATAAETAEANAAAAASSAASAESKATAAEAAAAAPHTHSISEISGLRSELDSLAGGGWSPTFAVAIDGARNVLQVFDWVGGTGTKPATGLYVGATGLVALIAEAADIRGLKGDKGVKGDTGDNGAAATIAVGTVTTGAAGSSATVTNTGTSSAAVLNFTIPRGNTVDPGGVTSVAGKTGVVTLAGSDVGLGNVDNTSDANKPVSTATQTALNAKFDKTGGGISGSVTVSGNLLATGGALGYGVGTGGAVTQAMRKSTTVTLNKVCGRITMHNAALAANDAVWFVMSNAFVGPTDEVSVWLVNPVNLCVYDVAVEVVDSGYCLIRLRNNTATSYSDSVVIGFAVRKGATS